MVQRLLMIRRPPGLDPKYYFTEQQLRDYGLTIVANDQTRLHHSRYAAVLEYALQLRTGYYVYDYKKLAEDMNLSELRITGGDRLSVMVCGERKGEEIRRLVSQKDLTKYRKKRFRSSYVWQEFPIRFWQDDETIRDFFRRTLKKSPDPLRYYAVPTQAFVDWNLTFPHDPVLAAEPDKNSGIFYIQFE